MTPKGANLEGSDLLEVSTLESGSYVTRSITGQEIIDAAAGSGVTDITVNAPLATTGGTTPDLSISEADGSTDGYLTAVDWNTFNDKQNSLTLTTTGTSGAATLSGATLNIPQYSGGGGASGIHALVKPVSGRRLTYALGSGNTGANFALSRLTLIPFLPANTFTISEILMYCNILGVGSLCRLLIYSDNNGVPDAKLYESADLNLSTIGFKIATTTFTFNAGTTYWLGFHSNATTANVIFNTAAVVYVIANTGTSVSPANGYNIAVALGSAPANINIASATFNTSNTPWIGLTPA
jgi:hypothetical protein